MNKYIIELEIKMKNKLNLKHIDIESLIEDLLNTDEHILNYGLITKRKIKELK